MSRLFVSLHMLGSIRYWREQINGDAADMANDQLLVHVLMPCNCAARFVAEMVGKGSYLLQVRNILVRVQNSHGYKGQEVGKHSSPCLPYPLSIDPSQVHHDL